LLISEHGVSDAPLTWLTLPGTNDGRFGLFPLTVSHILGMRPSMKHQTIKTRLVAALLVAVAIVGLSAFAVHAPTQNQDSLALSLKSIQTDKVTTLYAGTVPSCNWFVEMVLAGTSESKAAAENLKTVAATL
jgi:site-specific recombinase